MAKCIAYIRQSKDKDEQPNTEAAQYDALMRYHEGSKIQSDDWPREISWSRDIDVSGLDVPFFERAGGRQCQQAARSGDIIVVHKTDRLSRSLRDIQNVVEWFWNRGVAMHILDLPGSKADPGSATGVMFLQMLGVFAEFEVRKTRERTKSALNIRRQLGQKYNFRPGHGNKFVERDGKTFIEPDLELRAAIDKALEMHADGYPYHVIAAHFELNGPKPPAHFAPRWTGKNIGNLLRKERKIRAMRQAA